MLVDFEEFSVVDDQADRVAHVVGLVGVVGDHAVEVWLLPERVVGRLDPGRGLQVVLWQEREEVAGVLEALVLVVAGKVRHTGLGVVRHRPTQVLEADLLAGDRLDHVGAGDEHVRGLLDHEDEVGHRRRVDGAAGAGAHDQADLGDHARAHHVAHEHVAVGAQRDHSLLDPRPARVVDADDRAADLGGEVHQLGHLLAHDLAERAAENGEVLAEHAHAATVDRPVAGYHGVAPGTVFLHVEVVRAVAHEGVELLKGSGIEQLFDALARRHLAARVLLLLRLRRRVQRRLPQLLKLGELLLVRLGRLLARCAPVTAARRRKQRRVCLSVVRATRHRTPDVIPRRLLAP